MKGLEATHSSVPKVLAISWRRLLDYVRPKRMKLPLYGHVVTLPVEEPLEVPLTDIEGITEEAARERIRYRFLTYLRLVQSKHVSRDPTLLCAWWRLDAGDSPAAEQLMQPKSVGVSIRESEMEDLARTTLYTIQSFKKAFLPLESNPLAGTASDRQRHASLVKATEILLSHSHLAEATRRIQTQQELLAEARNRPNPFTVKTKPAEQAAGDQSTDPQNNNSSPPEAPSPASSSSRRPSANNQRKFNSAAHPAFKLMPMNTPRSQKPTATTKPALKDSDHGPKGEKDPPPAPKPSPVVSMDNSSTDVMEL
jgi:hypothetical protein